MAGKPHTSLMTLSAFNQLVWMISFLRQDCHGSTCNRWQSLLSFKDSNDFLLPAGLSRKDHRLQGAFRSGHDRQWIVLDVTALFCLWKLLFMRFSSRSCNVCLPQAWHHHRQENRSPASRSSVHLTSNAEVFGICLPCYSGHDIFLGCIMELRFMPTRFGKLIVNIARIISIMPV